MTTVPTTAASRPGLVDEYAPNELAERVERARDLIARNGLNRGGYWPHDVSGARYCDGLPVCLVGALAVACGATYYAEVETFVARRWVTVEGVGGGPDYYTQEWGTPHPVVTAVLVEVARQRGGVYTHPRDLWALSDDATKAEIVHTLDVAVAHLREAA